MPVIGGIARFGLPPAGRGQRRRPRDHGVDRSAVLARPYYGSRRMAAWLATQGHRVNCKRVQRLMRLMRLVAIYQWPNTSKPAPESKVYPYLLGGLRIEQVNQVWCADITYIPMPKGFLYLVAIMDWHSRPVLAWQLSNTLGADFCIEALEAALAGMASQRSSTRTRVVSSPAPTSPGCSSVAGSRSAWTARASTWTTSSSSGCGAA